ncbi:MAG: ribonuclease P protein component [Saprospiraceae bacterium]|nr:ribonuclease P protein component [Saprospiraceae bacterium]
MAKFTLKKKEILSGKNQIAELFNAEKSLFCYPLKVFYKYGSRTDNNASKVLFSVSVPKKKFKKAHDRNLLKRRIRESFRLNKYELLNNIDDDRQLSLMFIYIGNKSENYQVINRAVFKIFNSFVKKI